MKSYKFSHALLATVVIGMMFCFSIYIGIGESSAQKLDPKAAKEQVNQDKKPKKVVKPVPAKKKPIKVISKDIKLKIKPVDPNRTPDVVFVPTPQKAVEKMLEMAKIKKGDVLYDLGCGDGRIVVTAAKKYGIRAFGFDINPQRIKESRENVRIAKVGHLVKIIHADIFTLDLSGANVITLYLLPQLNVKLMPQLRKLKRGSRIVSFDFDMVGAKPNQVYRDNFGTYHQRVIYKWIVPWQVQK